MPFATPYAYSARYALCRRYDARCYERALRVMMPDMPLFCYSDIIATPCRCHYFPPPRFRADFSPYAFDTRRYCYDTAPSCLRSHAIRRCLLFMSPAPRDIARRYACYGVTITCAERAAITRYDDATLIFFIVLLSLLDAATLFASAIAIFR